MAATARSASETPRVLAMNCRPSMKIRIFDRSRLRCCRFLRPPFAHREMIGKPVPPLPPTPDGACLVFNSRPIAGRRPNGFSERAVWNSMTLI
jgi:hypothetical protein